MWGRGVKEMDKNYTLSEMALYDKAALRRVIELYMKWYDINWKQHVLIAKFHLDELMYIHDALSEDKFTIAITSLENNEQGSGTVDAQRLLIHIDTVVKKGGREVDRPALLSVWPILKQLIEAVRRAVFVCVCDGVCVCVCHSVSQCVHNRECLCVCVCLQCQHV